MDECPARMEFINSRSLITTDIGSWSAAHLVCKRISLLFLALVKFAQRWKTIKHCNSFHFNDYILVYY